MPVFVAEGVNPESAWSCLSAHHLAAYDAWYPEAFCFGAKTGLTLEIVLKAALKGMHTCTDQQQIEVPAGGFLQRVLSKSKMYILVIFSGMQEVCLLSARGCSYSVQVPYCTRERMPGLA